MVRIAASAPTVRFLVAGLLLVALAVSSRPARAASSWYTWDTCTNPAGNLPNTGQPAVRQVISMDGLSGNPGSFGMVVSLGRYVAADPAWHCAVGLPLFEFGPVPGIVPATAATCADVVPGLQLTGSPYPCVTPDGCLAGWFVQGTFPPGTNLDPARRYALVELNFDFTRVTPALCPGGSLANAQCFGLTYNSLASGPYFAQPAWLLSWNRADGNAGACAGVVPTASTTWGRLKSIYR